MKVARLFACAFALFCCVSLPAIANATPPYVSRYGSSSEFTTGPATISYIFALSASTTAGEANAHVIQPGSSVQSLCNGRLYILAEDREQFAAALAARANNIAVNIYYTTAGPTANTYFVNGTTTCKVIGIYF